jgi:signal transduction histidine kinase/CheY-like chemotaxis protein
MGMRLMREEFGLISMTENRFSSNPSSSTACEEKSLPTPEKALSVDGESEEERAAAFRDLTQDILSNAERAVDVLNDLLNYDKIDSGSLSLELRIIPIWDLIKRTIAEFELLATSNKIDLSLDFSPLFENNDLDPGSSPPLPQNVRECRVLGDTIRITQILRNLVSNGLKFTPEGGKFDWPRPTCCAWLYPCPFLMFTFFVRQGKLVVKASWVEIHKANHMNNFVLNSGEEVSFRQNGLLRLTVTDTGAGMSTVQLTELFHDGVQFNVNALQAGQGSGLGLYIAKGIAEQHHGTLTADSKGLGLGTTFTMDLPLFHVPDESLPSSLKHLRLDKTMTLESEDEKSEMHSNGGNYTPQSLSILPQSLSILVVDDALTNRKLLVRLLERRGHFCDQAKDGLEAVDRVKNAIKEGHHYDTILMDYEMPVMDGPTASKEINALGCDSLIVGITGNVLPDDVLHFKACGASAVLPKPLNLAALEELWEEQGVTEVARHDIETGSTQQCAMRPFGMRTRVSFATVAD